MKKGYQIGDRVIIDVYPEFPSVINDYYVYNSDTEVNIRTGIITCIHDIPTEEFTNNYIHNYMLQFNNHILYDRIYKNEIKRNCEILKLKGSGKKLYCFHTEYDSYCLSQIPWWCQEHANGILCDDIKHKIPDGQRASYNMSGFICQIYFIG